MPNYSSRKSQSVNGFSLIETLIAVIIFAMVGITVISSLSTSNTQVSNLNTKSKGLLALTSAAEILSATPYTFCSSTTATATPFTYTNALATLNNSLNQNTFAANERVIVEIDDVGASSDDGVSVITRSNDQEVSFTYCKDLMVNPNQFNDVYWGIQKITIKFTRYIPDQAGNIQTVLETGYRTIMKTFDNKDKNYSSAGSIKTVSQQVNCTSPFAAISPAPVSVSTNILQISQPTCFKLSVSGAAAGDAFNFAIMNADPSINTEVIFTWPAVDRIQVTSPEFLTSNSNVRNQSGKLSLDIVAFRTSTAEMAIPASLGFRVNALKVVDWSSGSPLNKVDLITNPATFINGTTLTNTTQIIPTIASGGVLNYTYAMAPSTGGTETLNSLTGLNFSTSTGLISGTPCANSGSFDFNFSVLDSNGSRATNQITLQFSGFAVKNIFDTTVVNQKSTASVPRSVTADVVQVCNATGPFTFSATRTATSYTGAAIPSISISPKPSNPKIGFLSMSTPLSAGSISFKVSVTGSGVTPTPFTTSYSITVVIT